MDMVIVWEHKEEVVTGSGRGRVITGAEVIIPEEEMVMMILAEAQLPMDWAMETRFPAFRAAEEPVEAPTTVQGSLQVTPDDNNFIGQDSSRGHSRYSANVNTNLSSLGLLP